MHRALYVAKWTAGLLCAVLTLMGIPLVAQQNAASVDQVRVGSSLVALTEVPVRDSAPTKGIFYVKGQQTGSLRSGEIITVQREQTVSTVLGTQKWVYFSRSERLAPSGGWVLLGNAGNISSNFAEKR